LEGEGKSLQEGRPPHASVRDPQGRRGPQEVQAVIPMAVAVINALLSVLLVIVVAWAAIWLVERMPLVPTEFKQVFILVLIVVLCPWDHLHEGHVGDFMDWDAAIVQRASDNLRQLNLARASTGLTEQDRAPL